MFAFLVAVTAESLARALNTVFYAQGGMREFSLQAKRRPFLLYELVLGTTEAGKLQTPGYVKKSLKMSKATLKL